VPRLLLTLDRAGEIQLPPVKRTVRNRLAERERPEPVIADNRAVRGPLGSITPLEFVLVRRTLEEPLFHSLMEQYHYLGYEQPVALEVSGEGRRQAIACLAWSSAPRHLKLRDRYIGWFACPSTPAAASRLAAILLPSDNLSLHQS
jgi:hypothetical protein